MAINRIVDAHVHLWDLNRIEYPWLNPPFSNSGVSGSVEAIANNYGLNEYFADSKDFNIEKIIHIEAGASPIMSLEETLLLQGISDESSYPQAIIAFASLSEANLELTLEKHCQAKNLRGIRQIINWHSNPNYTYTSHDQTLNPNFLRGFQILKKYNLSFDLQIYPSQMENSAKIAAQNPQTNLILNHMGMPIDRDAKGIGIWREGMKALAERENVFVKISGFGLIDHNWTIESVRPLVEETIEFFGCKRVMFASDFPTDKLQASFTKIYSAFDTITVDYSADEREEMFASNAEKIYKI